MNDKVEPCIIGIDPGISGAIAFYFPIVPDRIAAEDVPVAAGEIDAATLSKRILQMAPTTAIVEKVWPRPGEAAPGIFKFGRSYGTVIGILAAHNIPVHFVSPQAWKKHFRISSDKEESRALALQLFPATSQHFSRKKDHGRAEAALLALWGSQKLFPANPNS
jgi:hypothetical protein